MKYYLIAGEASGDLHGSRLVAALGGQDPGASFRAWGGDLMEAAGAHLVKHYRELAFMGFAEVVRNLGTILRNLRECKQDITAFAPDALILIDYPGFNLRIAKWAKKQGLRVFYYISPQIWAWHSSRVHGIKASVDKMFVILPFEKAFYAKYDYAVEFVGHPLLEISDSFQGAPLEETPAGQSPKPLIALLPGSRKQEIMRMLPLMLQMPRRFPDFRFVIAAAPAIPEGFYRQFLQADSEIPLLYGKTYNILKCAFAAVVTSGTATLETALFGVPQIVCYKGSPVSFFLARRLVQVKHISLVNLILDQPLLAELVQHQCTEDSMAQSLEAILQGPARDHILEGYRLLRQQLGDSGAADRTAKGIFMALTAKHGGR
jgi:lipid-A-disaccharide synthase